MNWKGCGRVRSWWRNRRYDPVSECAWRDWGNIDRNLNPAPLNTITAVYRSSIKKDKDNEGFLNL
jgi:hypothetical protein